MHEMTTRLPGTWLATRLGIDPNEIDGLRRRGELFAVRADGAGEWLYSAWQFGPGGHVPQAVRNVVRTATSIGVDEPLLLDVLKRRVGLTGGRRLVDLLFEGDGARVLDEVRAAAA